jgi:putative ABC transport system permease protein
MFMSLTSLRHTIRRLTSTPTLTWAAVLTLGVSIGAATAIYSAVQAVLLGPLPFREIDKLVVLWETDLKKGAPHIELSTREHDAWRRRLTSFEDLAAVTAANLRVTVTGKGEPVQVEAALVTPNFLRVLGVRPIRGRDFDRREEIDFTGGSLLIGEGFWTRQYGADPSVIGRTITVAGSPSTVVGILPSGVLPRGVDLWFSAAGLGKDAPDLGVLKLIGRLKPERSAEAAQAEVDAVAPSMSKVRPGGDVLGARLEPFVDQIYGQVRPAMHLLMAAVLSLLLIACANVANLLLARGVDRERELAVRAALGAGRSRLARMLFGESVVLGLGGGLLGVLVAVWGVAAVRRLIPADVPGIDRLAIDWRTLVFATGLSLLAAIVFGTVPALRAAHVQVGDAVRETTGRASSGRRVGRMRGLLVAGQLALSLGLVASAALTAQSFRSLARLAPGFDPRGVVTAKIQLSDKLADHRARAAFYRPLLERLQALPGVEHAALVLLRPLADPVGWDYPYTLEGQTPEAQARNPNANFESISPGYFAAVGIPLVDGRNFAEADGPDAGPIAIVSRSMARRNWPGESAIGKRIKPGPPDQKAPWKTVVGVVGDVRYREWTAVRDDIYVPYGQWNFGRMDLVVKASDPVAIVPAIRAAVRAADPDLPLASVTTLERAVDDATAGPRFTAVLLGVLALVALVVAAVGTFSVLAWSVERRTREIGVRVALGAQRSDVLRLVVAQATRLTIAGVVAGLAIALAAGRGLAGLLHAISPYDAGTLAFSVALLAAVGLGGGLLASRRALAVEPSRALRQSD